MIAIYRITNLTNNKCYIGSSINIEFRWKEHLNDLKANRHHSIKLQRSWNKYGSDNFEFKIVEKCEPENIFQLEQEYIDKYNSYHSGYNASFSTAYPGFIREDGTSNIRKPVLQLDKNNNILNEFPSLREAASKPNKLYATNILRCCRGEVKTHKGFKWKFKDDRTFDILWDIKQKEDVKAKWRKSNIGLKKPKQSETMKKLHATGLYSFGTKNCTPEQEKQRGDKISKSLKLRYKNNSARFNTKKVSRVNVQTGLVEDTFNSVVEAASKSNCNSRYIWQCLTTQHPNLGKKKGFVFKEAA